MIRGLPRIKSSLSVFATQISHLFLYSHTCSICQVALKQIFFLLDGIKNRFGVDFLLLPRNSKVTIFPLPPPISIGRSVSQTSIAASHLFWYVCQLDTNCRLASLLDLWYVCLSDRPTVERGCKGSVASKAK